MSQDLSYLFRHRAVSKIDSVVPSNSSNSGVTEVLKAYFNTMQTFHANLMDVQEKVMLSYLDQLQSRGEAQLTPASHDSPFLADAELSFGERTVVVKRVLRLSEDLYLIDHAIGGVVSMSNGVGQRVYLLPLMVALEMMTEAASLLTPHLVPTRIEEVRAYKRIRVGPEGCPIEILAHINPNSPTLVDVEIRLDVNYLAERDNQPLMSCKIGFADSYAAAPQATKFSLVAERQSRIGKDDLYTPNTMFHGPRLQSILQLDGVGDQALVATVEDRRATDWFACPRISDRGYLINPLLLDNASQLVLFYLIEHDEPVSALLPFYIQRIDFYNSQPLPASTVTVQAQLTSMSQRGTVANLEVIGEDAHTRISIQGIHHRRIALPDNWVKLVANPISVCLSQPLAALADILPKRQSWECLQISTSDLPTDEAAIDWLTDYILSPDERKYWSAQSRTEKRKKEWLLGRIASKEAIRLLIGRKCGVQLCPADIEILPTNDGKPRPQGPWLNQIGWTPLLSITHTHERAVALAADPSCWSYAGIDIEKVQTRDPGFEDLVLTPSEKLLVSQSSRLEKDTLITRLWCAKEAAAKALGTGLSGGAQNFQIECQDKYFERLTVRPLLNIRREGSGTIEQPLVTHTFADNGHVLALTIGLLACSSA